MKNLLLAAMVAITAWLGVQAQGVPAPEKYNEYLEQVATLGGPNAEFLIKATMESVSQDPKKYRQMLELAERRFSDPADALHNEALYMAVLNHSIESYVLSGAEKERQRLLLEGAKKNMVGTIAADFDYVTSNDKAVHRLKELSADYILIFFNNPDCESCELNKQRLAENELINQLVNEKKLVVLALYPYEDGKLWKKAKYPAIMINGWNKSQQIEFGGLYDLPTLPVYYLLNKDYKVLIKNEGSLNKVEAKLKELSAAPAEDPNIARSEQMFNMLLQNKGQELYDNLSDKVKSQAQPTTFDGLLSKVESQLGKYQSHEPWEIQQIQGMQAYTSLVNFEKDQLGLIVVFDEAGKMLGINLVPAQAIKKN